MTSVLDSVESPAGWERLPFGRLVQRSKQAGREDLQPLSVFLDEGVVPRASREDNFNRLGADMSKYLVVRPRDVVFNKLRTWQGGLGVSKYHGIVSPAYFVCRPRKGVESRFLHYMLRSVPYLAELTRVSKFMPPSQFDILWDDLRLVPILLPPSEEQRAIADYLDAETARIDALIAKKRRLIELLDERRTSMIHAGVSGHLASDAAARSSLPGLDDLGTRDPRAAPRGDGVRSLMPLKAVATLLVSNVDKKTVEGETRVRICNYVDVYYHDRITGALPFITASATPSQIALFELRRGDILFTKDSETAADVAVPAYVPDDLPGVVCGYHIEIARPRTDSVDSRYLFWALNSQFAREQFAVAATGVTRFGLRQDDTRSVRLPIPEVPTQRAIADYLDAETARIDALIAKVRRHIELLGERRQALITAAVSGELLVPGVAA